MSFKLSRAHTADGLRILCYHALSTTDEHEFVPVLFMPGHTFRSRLDATVEIRVPVLGLAEAVDRLKTGTRPPYATVITISDGLLTTQLMAKELAARELPATVYVTTRYMNQRAPSYPLAIRYAA